MIASEIPDFALSIVLGIGLAAATGFRVFLPMLIVSGAAYTGHLQLDNSFAWLATPSALTMLGVAAVAEILAYYVPGARCDRGSYHSRRRGCEASNGQHPAAFVQELRQLGWTEGRNLRIDVRWNAGDAALARIYAAQLIGLTPDVILTASTTNLTVIQQATNTVPVVFVQVSDPVEQGFVASITKPGGNLTGFSMYEFSVGGKWVDLLKEIAPSLSRVAVMFNPDTSPQSKFFMRSIEAAAPSHGVQAIATPVRTTPEIEAALQNFSREPNGGLILPTDTFTRLRSKLITELAERHRLPSISSYDGFTKDGGLIYYGAMINLPEQYRQAASYVDRILKGERPGDLPIQRAVKYALSLNLKTAKTLGLTVPLPLTGLADEVIE